MTEEQYVRGLALLKAAGCSSDPANSARMKATAVLRQYGAAKLSDITDAATIDLILDRWEEEL